MFRFEHSEYLWYLWVIPILLGLYLMYWQWRKNQLNQLGNKELLNRLIPGWADQRQHYKMALLLASLFFLLIAYAKPQWVNKK